MIAHIAIPAKDIPETIAFYESIGATTGRRTDTWAIFNFYGIQLVCHKSEDVPAVPTMYPRHFGGVLDSEVAFYALLNLLSDKRVSSLKRYLGTPSEHATLFLCDPSNNMIEFKWYKNREAIFGNQ